MFLFCCTIKAPRLLQRLLRMQVIFVFLQATVFILYVHSACEVLSFLCSWFSKISPNDPPQVLILMQLLTRKLHIASKDCKAWIYKAGLKRQACVYQECPLWARFITSGWFVVIKSSYPPEVHISQCCLFKFIHNLWSLLPLYWNLQPFISIVPNIFS